MFKSTEFNVRLKPTLVNENANTVEARHTCDSDRACPLLERTPPPDEEAKQILDTQSEVTLQSYGGQNHRYKDGIILAKCMKRKGKG